MPRFTCLLKVLMWKTHLEVHEIWWWGLARFPSLGLGISPLNRGLGPVHQEPDDQTFKMQSGISVSKELHNAFNELVGSPSQRGLIASIQSEAVVPLHKLSSSSSDFFSDLPSLTALLSDKQAAYILLRRYQNVPDGYVAVTFVPDAAPVRQKMLFASTRLTLVRELGAERFRESLLVTEIKELEKEGWEKHDASGELKAPLTEEEKTLKGVKEAEAEARG